MRRILEPGSNTLNSSAARACFIWQRKFHFGSQAGLAGSKPAVAVGEREGTVPRDGAASFHLGLLQRLGCQTLDRIAIQIFDSHDQSPLSGSLPRPTSL